ncbi:alkaline phosphatase family protein [Coraliomargarita sp. SDUM461003]|uniref:Alkaline phosphatase family protein n=1 Tax=Thalassobacterium maritimum TaxID=3041265 RepID=A0ABU1AZ97_9BACT|nr:alkaline phosphatase family protein [Coraliomargarita sp. SDUM461003]MDQ8209479.1 alkaline phosphatase family protein [Coraliomargarita sp. SDUM461003]
MQSKRKLLLVGWDSADWAMIRPLLDAGKLPALKRVIEGGCSGNLLTLQPVYSPMLWTSIATGKYAFKHGIYGFTEPDPQQGGIRPITSLGRKTKAFWNILSQSGLRCNVVGWWPSFPAEPIQGAMVANSFGEEPKSIDSFHPLRPGAVHPPELAEEMAELRVAPDEITGSMILPFIPDAAKIDWKKDKRMLSLRLQLAKAASMQAAATHLMATTEWDLTAVYFEMIDHLGHHFMSYHPPQQQHVSDEDFALYQHVMEGAYRFQDMMLQAQIEQAGENCTVMVLSDHGFHSGETRLASTPAEPAGIAAEHAPYGMIALSGAGIKQDQELIGLTVLDIAPTILNLFDLPTGQDMDGRVISEALEQVPNIPPITSWDDVEGDAGMHPEDLQIDPVAESEALQQLVALGYVDNPGEDKNKAAEDCVFELEFNRALSYIGALQLDEARTLLETLVEQRPNDARVHRRLFNLAIQAQDASTAMEAVERITAIYQQQTVEAGEKLAKYKDLDELTDPQKQQVSELLKIHPLAESERLLMQTQAYLAGNENDKALEALEALKAIGPSTAGHLELTARAYTQLKDWHQALKYFEAALQKDGNSASAHLGKAMAAMALRDYHIANEAALEALKRRFFYPRAHYIYGASYFRMHAPQLGLQPLQLAIHQSPRFTEAHEMLANCYQKMGDSEKAEFHRKNAAELKGAQT